MKNSILPFQHLQQQAVAQQQMEAQALWASSSISASPAHASDSEVLRALFLSQAVDPSSLVWWYNDMANAGFL